MKTFHWWCGAIGMMVALGPPEGWMFTHGQGLIIAFSIMVPYTVNCYLEKQQ